MLMTEWNWDDAKEVWQEEAREEGEKKGIGIGQQDIINLLKAGKTPEELIKEYDK